MRHYSTFMKGKDLTKLYTALVRLILEYSSVTYGLMLSKSQSNRLEQVQKRCLRIIFGFKDSYEDLLSKAGLESLKDRRQKAVLKFASKTSKNPNYEHLFPTSNQPRSSQRIGKKFSEFFAKTQRLYNSPLFTMRRLMNQSPNAGAASFDPPTEINLTHLFNEP